MKVPERAALPEQQPEDMLQSLTVSTADLVDAVRKLQLSTRHQLTRWATERRLA
jgi:hypothetical protein